MVEVTRKNFEKLLPVIAEKIENAAFVAFDAEYTGIYLDEAKADYSLFDTGSVRYSKLVPSISHFLTCQFGLAIFRKDKNNVYKAETYKFYLFPVSFENFAKREAISCQVSCMNFLARHHFDFNKLFKEGIPFLNQEKADKLRSFLQNNRHFMHTAEYLDPDYFPEKLDVLYDDDIEGILNRLAGFSKVIDVIHESHIPVVGHNCFLDLLLTYNLFWQKLPESYDDFKTGIHSVFNVIYDTKLLCRELKNIRKSNDPDDHMLDDSGLFALYANIHSELDLNIPTVELEKNSMKYREALCNGRQMNLDSGTSDTCHSADFDALITGCVFLTLSYFASRPQPPPAYRKTIAPTFSEMTGKTEIWRNQINIARARIPHINLVGPDPDTHRPDLILAKNTNGKPLDPIPLKHDLIKFGDVEVIRLDDQNVIIACGSMGCHRHVWREMTRRGCKLSEKGHDDEEEKFLAKYLYQVGAVGVVLVGLVFGAIYKYII